MQLDLIIKRIFSLISGLKISSHLHNYLRFLWKLYANVIIHEKRKALLFAGNAIDSLRKLGFKGLPLASWALFRVSRTYLTA